MSKNDILTYFRKQPSRPCSSTCFEDGCLKGIRIFRRGHIRDLILGSLLLCFSVGAAGETPVVPRSADASPMLHAGYAQKELVVPVGLEMLAFPIHKDGKISGSRSNQGTHDPVFIRCLVLREKETAIALVSADVTVVFESMINKIRSRVRGMVGTPAENLLVGATHNHQGPILDRSKGSTASAEWTRHVIDLFVRTIIEAHRELVPARVGFGHGFIDLNYNRHFIQPDGRVKYVLRNLETRFYGPADKEVVVMRVDHADGRPFSPSSTTPCTQWSSLAPIGSPRPNFQERPAARLNVAWDPVRGASISMGPRGK